MWKSLKHRLAGLLQAFLLPKQKHCFCTELLLHQTSVHTSETPDWREPQVSSSTFIKLKNMFWCTADDYVLTACISLLKHVVGNASGSVSCIGRNWAFSHMWSLFCQFCHAFRSFIVNKVFTRFLHKVLIKGATFIFTITLAYIHIVFFIFFQFAFTEELQKKKL